VTIWVHITEKMRAKTSVNQAYGGNYCVCSATELDSNLLLLLMDLVFSLLIGGDLGPAHLLHKNILSKMEKRWQLIDSPQSLRPLAAKGVAAR